MHKKDATPYIKMLIRNRIPHFLDLTTKTTIVRVPDPTGKEKPIKSVYTPNLISFADMHFIRKVKKEIGACHKEPFNIPGPISYFKNFNRQEGEFYDLIEIDVNGAYWRLAYLFGYISEDLYLEGLEVPKMTRLIALGAVASVKVVHEFDGNTYEVVDEIKNDLTRSYFFHIAYELGFYMDQCISSIGKDNCLFFWVDAFFVKRELLATVEQFFEGLDLGVKTKPVTKAHFKKLSEGWKVKIFTGEVDNRGGEKYKPFFFPVGDARKKLIARTNRLFQTGLQYKNNG
jgi:hypothetical protein